MTTTHPPRTELALELRDLSKTYDGAAGAVPALRGVSARFTARSFTAVMGPSGSGKSTLLHCAAGLDRSSSGSVLLAGEDLTGRSERELTLLRRERVGFVFQAYNLLPSLTVAQNLELPFRLAGGRPPRDAVGAALADVGLGGVAGRRPGELSGGQQQRVAIARALVTRPAVVFADEPTGALDVGTSREVLALLRRCVDELGRTVVLVTHDPVVAAVASRVLFLADGRLVDELAGAPLDPSAVAARLAGLETAC